MERNRIKALLATLVIFIATQASSAQEVNNLSVKQAVDYAIKNSVQVKNALLDIQVQRQTNKEITAAAYPQLSGSVNIGYNPNVATQTFPNFIAASTYGVLVDQGVKNGSGSPIVAPADFGFVQAQFGSKYSAGAGIDASQLLFDGQVFVGLLARKATIDYITKAVEVTEEGIRTNIYKIYYQLVVGRKQIESLDANIARFEKLFSDTREIYKNGFAEKLDVDKVEVQLNNIKTEKLKAENQIEVGKAALKFLMAMPQKDILNLTDTLSEDEIKSNILDESYNYDDRKEVQLLSIAKQLNQFNVKRFQLSKIPTITLSANYSKNAQRERFDFFKGTYFTSSFVGVRMFVPIFEGGARNARISKAKLEVQRLSNNLSQLQQSIDSDVEQARLHMKTAILTLDAQKRNIGLAEKVFSTTKLKYDQGLGSNLEIYTAQTELRVAQNNYYASLYDAIIAKIDYQRATGKLQ
ncbi:MAG: TolC family protein [Chitinophagaceae bacterium]